MYVTQRLTSDVFVHDCRSDNLQEGGIHVGGQSLREERLSGSWEKRGEVREERGEVREKRVERGEGKEGRGKREWSLSLGSSIYCNL